MYPDFNFLFQEWFGIDIPFLHFFKTFGFLVAIAFLCGGYIMYHELYRKEKEGLLNFTIQEQIGQKKSSILDILYAALIGFILGYKIVGMFLSTENVSDDPLSYLLSTKGHVLAGIIGTLFFTTFKAWQFFTKKQNEEIVKKVKMYPRHRVGDIIMIAAIGGFAGAKIFNALETWDQFLADPLGSLLSGSGLTFYGGLIVATIALWIYSKKIKLDFRHLCDATAPALILAYGIGRLGCQVAGDGDWGIFNAAYITNEKDKVALSQNSFEENVQTFHQYVFRHFEKDQPIPHKTCKAPAGIPTWLVAYNYPHNVNGEGIAMKSFTGKYNAVLPIPVFPTPLYEFVMCLIIFAFLWRIRKKVKIPLRLFSIYLIWNGIERFLIEQIRVNTTYDLGFIKPTQAEIIAVAIVVCGVILYFFSKTIQQKIAAKVLP
ncbi:MAG: prolipoprotein diacylglyceryl transferase [Chitinophagaceae bacterium]